MLYLLSVIKLMVVAVDGGLGFVVVSAATGRLNLWDH